MAIPLLPEGRASLRAWSYNLGPAWYYDPAYRRIAGSLDITRLGLGIRRDRPHDHGEHHGLGEALGSMSVHAELTTLRGAILNLVLALAPVCRQLIQALGHGSPLDGDQHTIELAYHLHMVAWHQQIGGMLQL